jgi:hypothetical protein
MKLKTLGIYIGRIPPESPPRLRSPRLVWPVFFIGVIAIGAVILILHHLFFNSARSEPTEPGLISEDHMGTNRA